jgi:hypothetical protein
VRPSLHIFRVHNDRRTACANTWVIEEKDFQEANLSERVAAVHGITHSHIFTLNRVTVIATSTSDTGATVTCLAIYCHLTLLLRENLAEYNCLIPPFHVLQRGAKGNGFSSGFVENIAVIVVGNADRTVDIT